jgi:hypothetical protein
MIKEIFKEFWANVKRNRRKCNRCPVCWANETAQGCYRFEPMGWFLAIFLEIMS